MVVGSCINGFRSQEENPLNKDLLTNFLDSERETKETPFTRILSTVQQNSNCN